MHTIDVLVGLNLGLLVSLGSRLTHGFTFPRRNSLPQHVPVTRWGCEGSMELPRSFTWQQAVDKYPCTPWMEDLPKHCFDCGFKTNIKYFDYIGGEISQHMVVVRYCVKGCGYSIWVV